MPYATLADLLDAIRQGYGVEVPIQKASPAGPAGGRWMSLWHQAAAPAAGSDGAAGSATPGAGGSQHVSSTGGVTYQDYDPSEKYLKSIEMISFNQTSFLAVDDRLVSISACNISSTGLKDINSAVLPRYADGVGVQVWAETTTAGSITPGVLNLRYTSDDNTSGRQGADFTYESATLPTRMMNRFPLTGGDRGVRSVQQVEVVTATTNGVVTIAMLKNLGGVPLIANASYSRDTIRDLLHLPRVYDGASIMFRYLSAGSAVPSFLGALEFVRTP